MTENSCDNRNRGDRFLDRMFGAQKNDELNNGLYSGLKLKIRHDCGAEEATEIINLPEINATDLMLRKIDISFGYMNLTTQKVNN